MLSDAVVSFGVVIAGGLILLPGAYWIDPAVTLLIVAVIVYGTWGLLRDSLGMALAAVPRGIDPSHVAQYLRSLPGVSRVRDLHIWPMSTTEAALTCHLVMPERHPGGAFLATLTTDLNKKFKIQHATVQIEVDENVACALEQDDFV